MTGGVPTGSVVVSRLRIVSPGDDALALRLRVSTLLGAARLEPPGLPPSALVVIRKLVGPLPGSISSRRRGGWPPLDWERAVSEAIDRMVRRAARPALEPVPADAQAVIFADTSEWLACLAADWLKGVVAERWWWSGLLRRADVGHSPLDAWLSAPESVPAALRHLADRGDAVTFARALSEDFARGLLDAVLQRFGLARVREVVDRLRRPPGEAPRAGTITTIRDGMPRSGGTASVDAAGAHSQAPASTADGVSAPPRLPRAPEAASAGLSPTARALLGVGLTLARAPAEARSPSFAVTLRHWVEAIRRDELGRAATVDRPSPAEPRPASPPPDVAGTTASEGSPDPVAVDSPSRPVSERPAEIPPAVPPTETAPPVREDGPSSSQPDAAPPAEEVLTPTASEDPAPLVIPLVTDFGGLFYLINLGLFLGLYGEYSTPAGPGIALDLWDFVAMVGLRLAGQRLRDDPVWPLLARLAGRGEGEPPGRDFDPGDDWRLPPEWLSAFPEPGDWEWDAPSGRLRVRHAEEFLVLDVPLENRPVEDRLDEEMRAYPGVVRRRGLVSRPEGHGPPVERWLDRLLPYLRARLLRALNPRDPESLGTTLCRARARVFVTGDRLDVVLSLQEHPIAIRLAGLDRDPGWVPAAGRFVAFHFE